MKSFLTKLAGSLVLYLVFTVPINGQTITFNFANPQITTGGTVYEFDITATSSAANTHFKVAQVYVNYNTAAFGPNIAFNGKVLVTKPGGSLVSTVAGLGGDQGIYATQANDNTSSVLSISNTWTFDNAGGGSTAYQVSNVLGTSPVVWVHVKITISDPTKSSNLSFNSSVTGFSDQQFYFNVDGPVNTLGNEVAATTKYTGVNVGGGIDDPLPVELNSFNAKVKQGDVELLWQTKTEVNNYGFEVERKSEGNVWQKISFVKGNGNSNSPKDYSFIDRNLTDGSQYTYRLKQLDNDGKFSYSDEVEVEVLPTQYELFQNYPNPFNPSTKIKFSLPEDSRVVINIYNMLGEKVMELVNSEFKAGYHQVQLNSSRGLASGVYIYSIVANNFSAVKKMVLMK